MKTIATILSFTCAAFSNAQTTYPDGRPAAALRMDAKDQGVILKHGDGPGQSDYLGAREALIFEENGVYHLFYDGAGPKGWLACLATSKDLKTWEKKGPILDFGKPGEEDSAAACSPWVHHDGKEWHMFYLGTPNATGAPDFIPALPYLTLKARSKSLAGPWIKQPEVIPFRCKPNTYHADTASPGHIVRQGDEYLMFFSASMKRTLGIARTEDLNGLWTIDPQPIVSPEEQIENSSLHFEPTNQTWFVFTNHIGLDRDEYTDAVWVYWTKDLNQWDPANKAVVLDGNNCTWSKKCIGMPSVIKVGNRLAVFYDAPGGNSTSHMNRDLGLAWLDLPLSPPKQDAAGVTKPRCEYMENPLGIDVAHPRLSWVIESDRRGGRQTAYQILVASSEELLKSGKGDLWDSGKVESDQSIHIEYAGKALVSRQSCHWKVRVWLDGGKTSGWSKPATWTIGLLDAADWQAKWIGHPTPAGLKNPLPARYVRKEFSLGNRVQRATAYVCGLGFFELSVNGTKMGDHVMDPVLTSYEKRCCYVTFDVTRALKEGPNAIGVVLGNGRFHAPRTTGCRTFGNPMLLLQMEVTYADGSTARFVSDDSWKVTDRGPIRANNEYDGEEFDARMEMPGWDQPGYGSKEWLQAAVVPAPGGVMQAQMMEPMRITEKIKPVSVRPSPKAGHWIVDFGQSFYGTVNVRVQGKAGDRVSLTGAYNLLPDGNLRARDNRGAQGTDVYTLKGGGKEEWHPIFCGRGFRYVEVSGFPGTPTQDDFEGLVIHTDVARAGDFECSNPLINRIHQNMNWGFRAFLRSVPLDPDRDERQGWNGDPAKVSESQAWNLNVAAFYSKWIDDHRHDQKPNGQLPFITPTFQSWYGADVLWPSTMLLIPEVLYNYYGERSLIERNYAAMKSFVDYGHSLKTPKGFIKDAEYCDWCDVSCMGPPGKRVDRFGRAKRWETGATDGGLLSTAYQYENEKLLAQFAGMLAKAEDVARYEAQAAKTLQSFNAEFLDSATGAYLGGTQCAQVVPLAFGMVPAASRDKVIAALIDDIMVKRQGHLSVGLIGMQWLMQTLTDIGRADVAYVLATQTTKPSWGYMIEKGSTTIWERWDTDTGDASMNSEALLILAGNLDAWFYQTLAGIKPDPTQPGFKHIVIRPQPVGDLTWARAYYDSPYGRIASRWKREGDKLTMEVTIPANTTATVYVPAKDPAEVTESGKPTDKAEGVKFQRMENNNAIYAVGSGIYRFQSTLPETIK